MTLGAILAGGRSQRFGGDKAVALLDGRRLIDHVASSLASHVTKLIVCGRTLRGFDCIEDLPRADLGPLGGINAALAYAADRGFKTVVTLPCDTPRLDPGLLAALATADSPVFLAGVPVIGSWPASLSRSLRDFLAISPDRSMRGWIATIDAKPLAMPPPANVNFRIDLEALGGG